MVIAILRAGLIFGMTLVLTGLANGFRVEARHTVDSLDVDTFVIKDGSAGPFLGSTPFLDVDVNRITAEPGISAAAPLACVGTIMREGSSTRNVTAVGAPEHGAGIAWVSEGRAPAAPDEVAMGVLLHLPRSATARARTDATVIGYSTARCPALSGGLSFRRA